MTRRNRCMVQAESVTREIPAPAGGVVIETFVPCRMVRRGIRKRIVTPLGLPEAFADEADKDETPEDTPLLQALGLAHHWQRLLDEGWALSVDEIAEAEGLDVSYVGRRLRLTLLEPQMVVRLAGGSSAGLEDLLGQPVPMDWSEHMKRLQSRAN